MKTFDILSKQKASRKFETFDAKITSLVPLDPWVNGDGEEVPVTLVNFITDKGTFAMRTFASRIINYTQPGKAQLKVELVEKEIEDEEGNVSMRTYCNLVRVECYANFATAVQNNNPIVAPE